jgi:hypothetical protein
MATADAAARLTEAHRLAQVQVSAETTAQLRQAWPLLDATALDATTERWLQVALRVIRNQRGTSANLSAQYLRLFRQLELGSTEGFVPSPASRLNLQAVITSLTVTGPVRLKSATAAGVPILEASGQAFLASTAAGTRHVLGGGRDTISGAITADPKCIGFARVCSGRPCAFCAMLCSRGPVYLSKASATTAIRGGGATRFHDGCHCTAEPIYNDGSDWPAGTKKYADLWQTASDGGNRSSKRTVAEFRRLVESGLPA